MSDNPSDHTAPWSTLKVSSLEDLDQHEPEILERIQAVPNGGNRFMAHPFALLSDINVDLTPEVRTKLEERIPELTGLSKEPYRALVKTEADQPIRFHMQGLFPDEEEMLQ